MSSDDDVVELMTPGASALAAQEPPPPSTSTAAPPSSSTAATEESSNPNTNNNPTNTKKNPLAAMVTDTLQNLTGMSADADADADATRDGGEATAPRTITLPSIKRFAQMVAEAGVDRGLSLVYEAKGKRLVAQLPGPVAPDSHQPHPFVDLVPYYNAYASVDPDDAAGKELVISDLLDLCEAKVSPLGAYEDAKTHIVPRIRLSSYYELFDLQTELRGDNEVVIPTRDVSTDPEIAAELALEGDSTVATVTAAHLDAWGVSFDEAFEAAVENVAVASAKAGSAADVWRAVPGTSTGSYLANFRDGNEAARILCHELIRGLEVDGDPVVVLPDKEILLVTGSNDTAGLEAILNLVVRLLPRLPSPLLGAYRLKSSGVYVPLKVPRPDQASPDDVNARVFLLWKNLVARGRGQEYHTQKKFLDKVNEKNETKVMTATATVMQHPKTGEVLTYCIWQMGSTVLLPVTDIVLFCTPENIARPIIGQAPYSAVLDTMGSALELVPMSPPRYSAGKDVFPTPEQLVDLSDNFEAPEMKDAAVKLRDMLAKAQAKRDREAFQDNIM